MKNLFRNCIYQGKNICRDFGLLFWSLLYPIVLVTFFHIAFSGITDIEFKNIDMGIEKGNPIRSILEGTEMLNIKEVSREESNEKLENHEIHGFVDKELNILVNDSGINQTIIKEIVEQIKQMETLNRPMEDYDFTADYIVEKNQKANGIMIIFYSLIAMVTTYGIFVGIETASLTQANLTNIGARLNMTPLKKRTFLFAGVIVAFVLNLIANGLLLLFIKYVLHMNLFIEMGRSAVFIILGNLFGVALGVFIGVSNKQNNGIKTMISIVVTLSLSFLSGMMSTDVKVMLDAKIPLLGKMNPIAIITNNLYKINLLGNNKDMGAGVFVLITYSVILMLGSYMFLRRRNYDSI
ncbi:MAG TPA: ABC transporter permease [Epulopiscium sp.]|nr:ABC transporter permease [Candidatus Epulonipiscium sp.]